MIRRYLVWQHRWTGLLMTLFLATVASTGSLLAYRVQIHRLLNPEFFTVPPVGARPLDLASLAERAESAEPRARVGYFYRDRDDYVCLRCVPRKDPATGKPFALGWDHLVLNPYTGAVLGHIKEYDERPLNRANFTSFLYGLHTSLLCGGAGWTFLGYLALVWTIDCFVGFYLALPTGTSRFVQRLGRVWLVKSGTSRYRWNLDLHRAGGLWLWPLLFVFAWSGVMLCLNDVYDKVTQSLFDYRPDMEAILAAGGRSVESPKLDWRAALKRGEELVAEQARAHHFEVQRASGLAFLPETGVYSYTVQSSLDFRRNPPQTGVWLDADTGELKLAWLPSGQHAGNTLGSLLWALHYGDLNGWGAYRALVSATGCVIVLLAVTGVYLWWRKRRARTPSIPVSCTRSS